MSQPEALPTSERATPKKQPAATEEVRQIFRWYLKRSLHESKHFFSLTPTAAAALRLEADTPKRAALVGQQGSLYQRQVWEVGAEQKSASVVVSPWTPSSVLSASF